MWVQIEGVLEKILSIFTKCIDVTGDVLEVSVIILLYTNVLFFSDRVILRLGCVIYFCNSFFVFRSQLRVDQCVWSLAVHTYQWLTQDFPLGGGGGGTKPLGGGGGANLRHGRF